jgi:hypothetical protein
MTERAPTLEEIQNAIRTIPDFPKPGILFKDITPLLADARLFAGTIEFLTAPFSPGMVDAVVGIDARGFIFAAAAALKLKAGFVPVRKPTNRITRWSTAPLLLQCTSMLSGRVAGFCSSTISSQPAAPPRPRPPWYKSWEERSWNSHFSSS